MYSRREQGGGIVEYYLAVDIGASSGRHILAHFNNGKLELEEVYRFRNELEVKDGSLCWNLKCLFQEIINGLKKCKEIGKIPTSMGIDTWAVDFVLLDQFDQVIGNAVSYRDNRTTGMDDLVYKSISPENLYLKTGIQKQIFNSIYQLMAIQTKQSKDLEMASSLLMIPDYLNFLLTGVKKIEYTNATTTQLVSPVTKDWDIHLIDALGFKRELFQPLAMPATLVGSFTPQIQEAVGFNCEVILPTTHDTAAAVMAIPSTEEDFLYISSGTWSLMGIEVLEANCSTESMEANFTNEGGFDYRFRYLKNIMGLWMIQSVKKEFEEDLSFATICELASKETISSLVDCNDESFLSPTSMIKALQNYCKQTQQQVPQTIGEIAAVIYNSLAKCYGETVEQIEDITNRKYSHLHVVGGGANASYLNELTARYTKKDVYAGPSEATAIGNVLNQLIYAKVFTDLKEARHCVKESFDIKIYKAN